MRSNKNYQVSYGTIPNPHYSLRTFAYSQFSRHFFALEVAFKGGDKAKATRLTKKYGKIE